jgi:hypothetical protein
MIVFLGTCEELKTAMSEQMKDQGIPADRINDIPFYFVITKMDNFDFMDNRGELSLNNKSALPLSYRD